MFFHDHAFTHHRQMSD